MSHGLLVDGVDTSLASLST